LPTEAILPRKHAIPDQFSWLDFAETMYCHSRHLLSRCQASSPALPETNPLPKNQWGTHAPARPELVGKLANFLTFPILSSHIRLVHFARDNNGMVEAAENLP
jgi:hypothetical protein